MRFTLARYLDGQPLQILGRVGGAPHTSDYLFNVQIWHESLLLSRPDQNDEPETGDEPEEMVDDAGGDAECGQRPASPTVNLM